MIEITKHRYILLQILKDIYSDIKLCSVLGFKGGTAAYLFYELGRFSVDLDFDLLDMEEKDYVFNKIFEIIKEYGEIKEHVEKRNTLFFLLSYKNDSQNIKVEVFKRNFGSRYSINNYLGIPMLVMLKEDMFAHKLVALLEREGKTNRDIYDVWFFLKNNWEINEEIIKIRTDDNLKICLEKCMRILSKKSNRKILSGIGELLDNKQKVWVKANLTNDTIFLLRLKKSEK